MPPAPGFLGRACAEVPGAEVGGGHGAQFEAGRLLQFLEPGSFYPGVHVEESGWSHLVPKLLPATHVPAPRPSAPEDPGIRGHAKLRATQEEVAESTLSHRSLALPPLSEGTPPDITPRPDTHTYTHTRKQLNLHTNSKEKHKGKWLRF